MQTLLLDPNIDKISTGESLLAIPCEVIMSKPKCFMSRNYKAKKWKYIYAKLFESQSSKSNRKINWIVCNGKFILPTESELQKAEEYKRKNVDEIQGEHVELKQILLGEDRFEVIVPIKEVYIK